MEILKQFPKIPKWNFFKNGSQCAMDLQYPSSYQMNRKSFTLLWPKKLYNLIKSQLRCVGVVFGIQIYEHESNFEIMAFFKFSIIDYISESRRVVMQNNKINQHYLLSKMGKYSQMGVVWIVLKLNSQTIYKKSINL